ncbi:hypothetical protein [Rhizobium lusitanum]|uniref:hypothetical protein n=1 Tax=Rhizobium lusitanum TaxID=293958 RepID=UPI00195E0A29|nr:hypothetical protein [Rhizobium lusitanum]MBM7045437.1 hypothetical protein [Rhizobium lusitanum]
MASIYLQPTDYAAYGITGATAAQVQQASAYVDGYLKRPEGLICANDAAGNPCYMVSLNPTSSWTFPNAIAPGIAVTVHAPLGLLLSMDLLGQVIILDRAVPNKTEAAVITNVNPAAGTIILGNVTYSHSAGAIGDFGLTNFEERSLPSKRSMIRMARQGVTRLISGVGRYGYGRRSDQIQGMYNEINLLATLQTFGGPPQWIPFDVTQASISPTTAELWVPAGILLAYYTDVRVWYVAGYPASGLPDIIKQATAAVVDFLINAPPGMISGGFKRMKAGDTELDRFTSELFSSPQYSLMASFRAVTLG